MSFALDRNTRVYSLLTLIQTVLIHSASGGVGLAAIDLCRYLGAEVSLTHLETNFMRLTGEIFVA